MAKLYLPVIVILLFATVFISKSQETSDKDKCKVLLSELVGEYEGECKKGLAHGFGKAIGQDTYEGEFKKGLPDGEGTYTWSTGEVYSGEWKKGLRNGLGKYTFKFEGRDSIQEGDWKKDEYIIDYSSGYEIKSISTFSRKVDFVRFDVGNKVQLVIKGISPSDYNYLRDQNSIILMGSSGTKKVDSYFTGFENIDFPFSGKITISVPESGGLPVDGASGQPTDAVGDFDIEFDVTMTGYWKIIIY